MAQIEIPEDWRRFVCAILATEETGTAIQWTRDAEQRYQSTPGAPWFYEVYEPLRDFLSQPVAMGCAVKMDSPPGEAFEFFFMFRGTRFYGKILLRADKRRVVLFSAHLPLKPRLSCD